MSRNLRIGSLPRRHSGGAAVGAAAATSQTRERTLKDIDTTKMSADEWDELNFPRPEVQEFDRVVEHAISRRGFLGGVLAFGSGAAVMSSGLLNATTALAQPVTSRFPFKPIPAFTDATVHVPEGYDWKVLARWGDALSPQADGYTVEEGGS